MSDFNINNEEYTSCDDLAVIIGWMSHTDQLITIAENDVDLQNNKNDISMLYLRKSSLFCSVNDFYAAKGCAEHAVSLDESSLGHFRLGCIQYCLHEYQAAMESLLIAERLEPSNPHIQRALLVCLARARSLKDRIPVVASMS
jgi:tetratricopeptide (TPR) repeat protein